MLEGINDILVSIIVPIYNVEHYLTDCLNSVLTQTYRKYEIILVDDGSTDGSLNVCYSFQSQDPRIKVFSKTNGGLSSARNYGINKSKGDYVIFLDPDDFWINPEALEKLVKIAHDTQCDIVRGEHREVNQNGTFFYKKTIPDKLVNLSGKVCSSIEFLHGPISTGNFVWLFLIKRTTLYSCHFNEEQEFQEDIEFNIRYFSVPRSCVYLPLIFYAYRKREKSLTSTLNIRNLKYSFMLCDVFYEYSKKTKDIDTSIHYMRNAIMMYYWTLETVSLTPLFQQRQIIIKELGIVERRNKVIKWIKESQEQFPIIIRFSPNFGIKMFRIKNLFLGYYICCKKTIQTLCGTL